MLCSAMVRRVLIKVSAAPLEGTSLQTHRSTSNLSSMHGVGHCPRVKSKLFIEDDAVVGPLKVMKGNASPETSIREGSKQQYKSRGGGTARGSPPPTSGINPLPDGRVSFSVSLSYPESASFQNCVSVYLREESCLLWAGVSGGAARGRHRPQKAHCGQR